MNHSKNYEKVLQYYKEKVWTLNRVRLAVGKWITKKEFEDITGETYDV